MEHDDKPWYKQFWPWFLIALPASVVVAGIGTVILAVKTPLNFVESDYYKEGLAINENLAARELANFLGMAAELSINESRIQVDLNQGLTEALLVKFIHPTDTKQDRQLELERIGAKRFELETELALQGRYTLELVGIHDQGVWELEQQTIIDSQSDGVVLTLPVLAGEQSL